MTEVLTDVYDDDARQTMKECRMPHVLSQCLRNTEYVMYQDHAPAELQSVM